MDPDANLAEQRRIVARLYKAQDDADTSMDALHALAVDAFRLAELSESLDQWISKGGFLPAAWRKERS